MEDRDVLVDHDMDVRNIEPPLERSEAGSDAVGEYVVGHVGVGTPSRQPIEDAGRAPGRVADVAAQPLAEPARGTADIRVGRDCRDGSDRHRSDRTRTHEDLRCSHDCSLTAHTGRC